MMDKNQESRFWSSVAQWFFWIASIVLVVLASLVVYIYVSNFGGGWSLSQAVWGEFGDYFGGVVGPVVAALALIALLISIRIQIVELSAATKALNAQVDHQRSEAEKSDLMRAIESLDQEIYKRLNARVSITANLEKAIFQHANYLRQDNKEQVKKYEETEDYCIGAITLRKKFLDLADVLLAYEGASKGNYAHAVTNVYRRKWLETLQKMVELGLLRPEEADPLFCDEDKGFLEKTGFRVPNFLNGIVSEEDRWW